MYAIINFFTGETSTYTRSSDELENVIHQELDCDNPSNAKFCRQYSHSGAHSLNVPAVRNN